MGDDVCDDFSVATTFDDPDRVSAIASYFETSDGVENVDRHTFDGALDRPLTSDEAMALFTCLVRNGVASQRTSAATFADYGFAVESDRAATALRQQTVALTYRNETTAVGPTTTAEVVATVPPNVSGSASSSVRRHSAELRSLLLDADDEVRIAVPYFDSDEEIVADIASLPNQGVETRILTREARTNSSTSETIDRIRGAVDDDARGSLEVRDLHELNAASGTQAYATHAKAIVADDQLCYLGSANLTTTSLGTNFELGVVLTGSAVDTVANLFDSVFGVSRPVGSSAR